ncbi:MAG: 2-amino-4-hydroxy-6-hydroxymethyldihydropteridine diphosphokinase [Flavobacterium sp.]
MKFYQNRAVLSLGSNIGDRKQTIVSCIDAINEQVAIVADVSKLYESEAWGFSSDAFLNCAVLIHTSMNAQELLSSILKLELELGRKRSAEQGYQARNIDIDIIAFNEEIINIENLQIPHKEMQNRKFVLLPMCDLNFEWKHPILHKTKQILLETTSDDSACVPFGTLQNPIKKYHFANCNYIAIEGNIGAGKTTLAKRIADDFNAKTVLERFADNPFLPKFYEDQNRYAFPLEMSFLADRYQQITDDLEQFDLFKDFIVADYHVFKSLIFSKITLAEEEFRLYSNLFDIMYRQIPKPDLYIYLYQNSERLLSNIKKRGRDYEQHITSEYLEKINRGYLEYIKSQRDLNVLIIDASDLDFVNREQDYHFILRRITEKLSTTNF